MIRRPPRSTQSRSSAASDVYKRQERIKRELSRLVGYKDVVIDYPMLQALPGLIRASSFDVTVTVLDRGQEIRAVRLEKGDTSPRQAAIAIDLGTTTISAQLVDLQTGEVIAEAADYNGQITYGEDIITRIIYSTRATGLAMLQSAAVKVIWNLCLLYTSDAADD